MSEERDETTEAQERTDAQERIEQLERENTELRQRRDPDSRLSRLERRAQVADLGKDYGLAPHQARLVQDILDEHTGLDPAQAIVLAEADNPDSFPRSGHAQLRPGSRGGLARPNSEVTQADRLAYGRELAKTNKRAASALFSNECGHHLAQAMGWEHHRTPIPAEAAGASRR